MPTLATVATTGDYDDLTNKPTIPAAVSGTNDGTNWTSLTIGNSTYGIGGGSSEQVYIFNKTDNNGTTTNNASISNATLLTKGLDLTQLAAGTLIDIVAVVNRRSNNTNYLHKFTLVIPDANIAPQTTDTFILPGVTNAIAQFQLESWLNTSDSSRTIGLYGSYSTSSVGIGERWIYKIIVH